MDDELTELLAEAMHDSWVADCVKNGIATRISSITGEEQMVPYADLSETVKDFDRNGARAFLATLNRLGYVVMLNRKTFMEEVNGSWRNEQA